MDVEIVTEMDVEMEAEKKSADVNAIPVSRHHRRDRFRARLFLHSPAVAAVHRR